MQPAAKRGHLPLPSAAPHNLQGAHWFPQGKGVIRMGGSGAAGPSRGLEQSLAAPTLPSLGVMAELGPGPGLPASCKPQNQTACLRGFSSAAPLASWGPRAEAGPPGGGLGQGHAQSAPRCWNGNTEQSLLCSLLGELLKQLTF